MSKDLSYLKKVASWKGKKDHLFQGNLVEYYNLARYIYIYIYSIPLTTLRTSEYIGVNIFHRSSKPFGRWTQMKTDPTQTTGWSLRMSKLQFRWASQGFSVHANHGDHPKPARPYLIHIYIYIYWARSSACLMLISCYRYVARTFKIAWHSWKARVSLQNACDWRNAKSGRRVENCSDPGHDASQALINCKLNTSQLEVLSAAKFI